jgi:uncharacterized glyoxalase superfamily protein PhnB
MKLPAYHQTVMPYLILYDPQQFIAFSTKVFAAEVINQTNLEDGKTIIHAEIHIQGSTIMFGAASGQWAEQTTNLFVYVQNVDATFEKAKLHGAKSVAEPENKDYGRTAGVQDPCGNTWWITEAN